MIGQDIAIYYTDGWHPAVNPSSRMAIHHFRFIELLNARVGILNEFPRRRGGCTLRFMRFADQGFSVLELPTPFELIPWWMPASSGNAHAYLYPCFDQALQQHQLLSRREQETIEGILGDLQTTMDSSRGKTLGEVLNEINDRNYRAIIPELPQLDLLSFTKSPIRHVFASAARTVLGPDQLSAALSIWAAKTGGSGFPMLAVGCTADGSPCRVGWSQEDERYTITSFDPRTGSPTSTRAEVDAIWLMDALDAGAVIPGSRLASLLEVAVRQTGASIKHFGNNYGRLKEASELLEKLSGHKVRWEDIVLCEDDADSWHVAVVRDSSQTYPVHLIDMLLSITEASLVMSSYVRTSLSLRGPVILHPGSDLSETLLDRRP